MRYIKTKYGIYPVLRGNGMGKVDTIVDGKRYTFAGADINKIIGEGQIEELLYSIVTNATRFYPPFDFDAIMEKATYEVVKIGKTKSTKKEFHLPIHGFVWTPNGDKAVADFVYRKNQPVMKGERKEGWWSLV